MNKNHVPFTKKGVRQMSTKYLMDTMEFSKNPRKRLKAADELARRKYKVPCLRKEPLLTGSTVGIGRKVLHKKDPIVKLNESNEEHFSTL